MKHSKIGLEQGTVRLEEHTPYWHESFKNEERMIKAVFGGALIQVAHIGSTAVSTLKAKPIVDILLVLTDFYNLDLAHLQLESIGFYKGPFERDEGIFFQKGNGDMHTHYLHLFYENQNWEIYIQFRDHLIHHPEATAKYEELKLKLEAIYPTDRKAYTAAKNHFIENILSSIR